MNIEKKAAQKSNHDEVLAAAPKEVSLAQELKALVQAAQQGQQEAIDRLCDKFKGLVKKEAHLSYVQDALGEDAENTLWEIFLEIIYAYQGNKYRLLPGLIAQRLHFLALKRILKKSSVDPLYILDAPDTNDHTLQLADETNALDALLDDILSAKLLHNLTEKQRDVIIATIFNGYSLIEYSKLKNISYKVAYLHRAKALKALREALSKLK